MVEIQRMDLPAHPDLQQQVTQLLAEATDVDGVPPFSEQFLLGLRDADRAHQHWLALAGGADTQPHVVGILASDGATGELAVHPEHRRQQVATQLVDAAATLPIWAHGNVPAARGFAASLSRSAVRELLVMQARSPFPAPELPQGFEILSLPDAQQRITDLEQQWLQVNNAAFSWHPEQGGWDATRLRQAQDTDWFRPEDVLFCVTPQLADAGSEAELKVAGFHWTKRHGDLGAGAPGEVYVVGLAPDYQGQGLGKQLTLAGLHHLEQAGAQRVDLYVEADNAAAVATYEALGFQVRETHVLYAPVAEK